MPIVVDTYNVLHVTGVLPAHLAGIDVAGLAELLEGSRYGRVETILICDGTGGKANPRQWFNRHILVQYSGPTTDADSAIRGLIERSSSPRRLMVVSSDGHVVRAARRRRCRVESSERFLGQLAHDAQRGSARAPLRRPTSLNADHVARWIRTFGVEPALLAIPSSRPASHPSPIAAGRGDPHSSAPPAPAAPATARPGVRPRALEHVKTLDEVDEQELERFNMGEWLNP